MIENYGFIGRECWGDDDEIDLMPNGFKDNILDLEHLDPEYELIEAIDGSTDDPKKPAKETKKIPFHEFRAQYLADMLNWEPASNENPENGDDDVDFVNWYICLYRKTKRDKWLACNKKRTRIKN